MITILRSVAFNISFYLNTAVFLVIGLPTFLMPYQAVVEVAKTWGRVNLVLLRVIAGVDVEIRGRDKIPPGALIVAAKHQSAWETFALLHLFASPTFIMKRELQWIPVFGWLTIKGRMVAIDRGAAAQALVRMAQRAQAELRHGRQLIIFPEGTRRSKGLRKRHEARWHTGAARIALSAGVPLIPAGIAGTDRLGRLGPLRVAYGPPIETSDLGAMDDGEAAQVATDRLRDAITGLEQVAAGSRPEAA